ncbi:hypothetical protein GYMLUDRAFT_104834, partial [Collybiopsis luxurians FD-317 M1]
DQVMLATLHSRNDFKKASEKCITKFFPRYNGPYEIVKAYPETLRYTLDMHN